MHNERKTPRTNCAIDATMSLIEGKWKCTILCILHLKNSARFTELQKNIPNISSKVLTNQLRELTNDGLITRTVYPETPVRIVYSLTERGKSLLPVMKSLATWGLENMFPNMVEFDDDVSFPGSMGIRSSQNEPTDCRNLY